MSRWWHALTDTAEVSGRPFHATRRTTLTLLHERGVPIEVASKLVGHSSYAITADIYTAISADSQLKAAQEMGRALAKPRTRKPKPTRRSKTVGDS